MTSVVVEGRYADKEKKKGTRLNTLKIIDEKKNNKGHPFTFRKGDDLIVLSNL